MQVKMKMLFTYFKRDLKEVFIGILLFIQAMYNALYKLVSEMIRFKVKNLFVHEVEGYKAFYIKIVMLRLRRNWVAARLLESCR